MIESLELEIDSINANMMYAKKQVEALLILIAQISDQMKTIEKENKYTKSKLSDLRSLIASWTAQDIPVNTEVLKLEMSLANEMKKIDELNAANLEFRNYFAGKFGQEIVFRPTDAASSPSPYAILSENNHVRDAPEIGERLKKPVGQTERNVFEEVIIGLLRISGSMSRKELKNMLFQTLEQRFSEDDLVLSPENTPIWWDTARGAIYNLSKTKRISLNKDEGTFSLNEDYTTLKDFELTR